MKAPFSAALLIMLMGTTLLATCGLKTNESGQTTISAEKTEELNRPPVMPDSLFFMGVRVPLERFDVYESLERELLVNAFFHSQTFRFIKLMPRYFTIIDPILKEEGVPADLKYLCMAESNMNPRALSPAGAAGFWQFLKSTAIEYGLEVNAEVDERYHIEKSTRAACRYLKKSYAKYQDWPLVAASYNAGVAAIDRQLERQMVSSYFDLLLSEETERYIYRILALKIITENPEKYGFQVDEGEKYPLLKTRKVEVTGAVLNLAALAKSYGITYKTLKYYNPWLRENQLTNKAGKTYILEIPD